MVWGAMIAIASIAKVKPETVYNDIDLIRKKLKRVLLSQNVHGVYALINMAGSSERIYNDIIGELFDILEETRPVDYAKRAEALAEILTVEDKCKLKESIEKKHRATQQCGSKACAKAAEEIGLIANLIVY